MILEQNFAQVSYYISPDLYYKMSFSSENDLGLSGFETREPKIQNNLFSFDNVNYTVKMPYRLGFSLGVKFKNRNEITLGFHADGVSSISKFSFISYSPLDSVYRPFIDKSGLRTIQNRVFIAYKYYLTKKDNKTNLCIIPTLGMAYRPGNYGIVSTGSFGGSGMLTPNKTYELSYTGYTTGFNKALLFGIGIGSDIYSHKKYLFSLYLQYSYSRRSLGKEVNRMSIEDLNTGKIDKYEFSVFNRASGLYLTLSRKLFVYPRRNKDKNKSS